MPIDKSHNPKVPINRLLTELLAHIFLLLCYSGDVGDHSWVLTSHVCASWREIALDTPGIWRNIILVTETWMQRCLHRAKSALLIVALDAGANSKPAISQRFCRVLELTHRIEQIHLRCDGLSFDMRRALRGPFPQLIVLTAETRGDMTIAMAESMAEELRQAPSPSPLPQLRHLTVPSGYLADVPRSPSSLVSLELTHGLDWDLLRYVLQPLQQLEILNLAHTPNIVDTSPSAESDRICLPLLQQIVLGSESSGTCAAFLRAMSLPSLKKCQSTLTSVVGTDSLLSTLHSILGAPLSLCLERAWNDPEGRFLPQYLAQCISFSYTEFSTPWSMRRPAHDIVLTWHEHDRPHTFAEAGVVFSALANCDSGSGHFLRKLQWICVDHWNISPPEAWAAVLRHLQQVRTLVCTGYPPAGIFWALIREAKHAEVSTPVLLPRLQEIVLRRAFLGDGGWIAPTTGTGLSESDQSSIVASIFELDGARFIEVLIRYLELRCASKLPKLMMKMLDSGYTTGVEIKYLRMLLAEGSGLLWDGRGLVPPVYAVMDASIYDRFVGLSINHTLLEQEPGYEVSEQLSHLRWPWPASK
ncbi:hypothetical protein C8F01DRAFT_760816 [Mycena amicta]|nr:hypothetical protein C8F01DRAFT_130247 [Mycena amicta]KAJ7049232.1 hypothetical protein C8F01DRAFT_760816 [Mycena amicta]